MQALPPLALPPTRNFIAGHWERARSGALAPVHDPATGALIAETAHAGRADALAAVAAAEAALPQWRATPAEARGAMLSAMAAVIEAETPALAALLTAEQGKPLAEARAELGMSARYLRWFAAEAPRAAGAVIPSPWPGRQLMTVMEPVGVVAAITPWNFPSSMLARKIGPALAAGCTMVAKPAPQTPLSGLAWGLIAERAGLPAGVLNIVAGEAAEVGGVFLAHPSVRKLSFTGSTATGLRLLAAAAATAKTCSMELGGNAPFIVLDDADLDAAVEGAIAAKFRNAGQTCVCANRIFAHEAIHDAFLARLAARVADLRVGPGNDPASEIGPMIDAAALAKAEALVADAVASGAEVLCGGVRLDRPGHFFAPTLLAGATDAMRCAREEIFGPVAPVFRFGSDAEVLSRANTGEGGLAAYVYSRDLARALHLGRALDCGIVGVNEGLVTTEAAPFGGTGLSGFGREGGREGIHEYMAPKYLCIGGLPA